VGFASYLEDIQTAKDALRAEIHAVGVVQTANGTEHRQLAERAASLVRAAERLACAIDSRIEYYLTLATDPSVELVDLIETLDRTKRELETEVAVRTRAVHQLRVTEQELRSKIKQQHQEVLAAKKAARRSERAFERLAAENPAAAYDLYSSAEQIRRHKPNA